MNKKQNMIFMWSKYKELVIITVENPGNSNCEGKRKTVRVSENSSYRGKFQWNFDQGKEKLVRVSGESESSEFELSGFYCSTKAVMKNSGHMIVHIITIQDQKKRCPVPF